MSIPRAFAFRLDLPREPGIVSTELADLLTSAPSQDALHIVPPAKFRPKPAGPVPGTLVTGTLPPENRARFLLRVPKDWNGKLVVAASSGVTDETTYDLYFSDDAVSKGYAFAATDKGVRRVILDGDTVVMPMTPESSVRRWASRLEALIAMAKTRLPRAPERVYAVGLSNGGFVARRACELGLVDGGVEVSGVMWRADRANLLTQLPALLRATAAEPWDAAGVKAAGFPSFAGPWKALADLYKLVYWEASLALFVSDLDPSYDGPMAEYDPAKRPGVLDAVASFQNTGDLKCPLVSIAGRQDWLIPYEGHAKGYADLVASKGKGSLHRLVTVDDASHIDTNAEAFPFVEPLMPRLHEAFAALASSDAMLTSPAK